MILTTPITTHFIAGEATTQSSYLNPVYLKLSCQHKTGFAVTKHCVLLWSLAHRNFCSLHLCSPLFKFSGYERYVNLFNIMRK